jgi:hypothetical protein
MDAPAHSLEKSRWYKLGEGGRETEIERLKCEGFIPVEPIKPEPVVNEPAYLIMCEPQMREQ